MKCVICKHGETAPGEATMMLTRGDMILVVKGVPARVCATCGEEYVDEAAARHLVELADEAAKAGVQVDVRQYVVA